MTAERSKNARSGLEGVDPEAGPFDHGRPPPWSEEAEISVLGAMLLDGDAVPQAVKVLGDGKGFYKRRHRTIYTALRNLHQREHEPEVVALSEELKARENLEAVGGMKALAQLIDAVPTSANIEQHARVVAEKATARRLQELCRNVVARTFEAGPGQVADVVEDARAELEGLDVPVTPSGVDLMNMADWMEDPDALNPPECIAHGIVYRGQNTLLYADPKGGKTTAAAAVTAAVSSGSCFMGPPTIQGPALYIAAEGDRDEIFRRLYEFGAKPENVDVVVPGTNPLAELRTLMEARDYRLVVIDTLGRWMAPLEVDRWKQSDVDTVLVPLEHIIRESEAGLLALHHTNAAGKPIDSTGFAAWADVLRKMEDGEGPRERVVTDDARFTVPDLRFRLGEGAEGSRLVPVDPDRELEERVLEFLEVNADASKRAVREAVSARATAVDDALKGLMEGGIVECDRSGPTHSYRIRQNPHGHATDTIEHGDGHASTGNGGVTVSEGVPPSHGEGDARTRSPSPVDSGHEVHDDVAEDHQTLLTDAVEDRHRETGAASKRSAGRCLPCVMRFTWLGSVADASEPRQIGPTADCCGRCRRYARTVGELWAAA